MSRDAETRPFTILVEGNIGYGKSSFVSRFLQHDSILVLLEPLAEYRDVAGENLLEQMYEDPSRYAYPFQHHALMVMRLRHLRRTLLPYKMMERSIFSTNFFFEARRRMGRFGTAETHLLTETFNSLTHQNPRDLEADLIVYLRLRPALAFSRVSSRARNKESRLPLDYLEALHEVREEWLVRRTFSYLPAPVLVLDASLPADACDPMKDRTRIRSNIAHCSPSFSPTPIP